MATFDAFIVPTAGGSATGGDFALRGSSSCGWVGYDVGAELPPAFYPVLVTWESATSVLVKFNVPALAATVEDLSSWAVSLSVADVGLDVLVLAAEAVDDVTARLTVDVPGFAAGAGYTFDAAGVEARDF